MRNHSNSTSDNGNNVTTATEARPPSAAYYLALTVPPFDFAQATHLVSNMVPLSLTHDLLAIPPTDTTPPHWAMMAGCGSVISKSGKFL